MVLELPQCLSNVPRHGKVYLLFGVIPIQRYAYVTGSGPINAHLVVFCDDGLQVLGMFSSDVFYTEIVNDQGELDGSPIMCPQSRDEFALPVAMLVESFFEELVGE